MTRTRASIAYGPPFAYELVARRAKPRHLDAWDLSAWRVAGCGAEPLRPAVLRAFGEALRPAGFDARALTPAYGLAESTLIVTSREVGSGVGSIKVDPDALANNGSVRTVAQDGPGVELVSCGPQVQDTEVRIAYDGGWGSDHQGEVWVRGASVARGYWNAASANRASFVDGWLRTGDLGFLKDGELYVTGRLKDLVIRNGSNYHPHDIEHAFAHAAGIRLSHIAVFSGAEEELVVAVEGRAQAFDGADVFAGIRHVVSTIGVSPDRVVFVPRGAIARTSSGKVRRQELRRRFIAGEIEIVDLDAGVGADRYGGEGA
jgi:fatty-acyl-CoA synthase